MNVDKMKDYELYIHGKKSVDELIDKYLPSVFLVFEEEELEETALEKAYFTLRDVSPVTSREILSEGKVVIRNYIDKTGHILRAASGGKRFVETKVYYYNSTLVLLDIDYGIKTKNPHTGKIGTSVPERALRNDELKKNVKKHLSYHFESPNPAWKNINQKDAEEKFLTYIEEWNKQFVYIESQVVDYYKKVFEKETLFQFEEKDDFVAFLEKFLGMSDDLLRFCKLLVVSMKVKPEEALLLFDTILKAVDSVQSTLKEIEEGVYVEKMYSTHFSSVVSWIKAVMSDGYLLDEERKKVIPNIGQMYRDENTENEWQHFKEALIARNEFFYNRAKETNSPYVDARHLKIKSDFEKHMETYKKHTKKDV